MTDPCNKCADSGELRAVIEEVAEKAAVRAAESVAQTLRIEMMHMERRLEEKVAEELDTKLRNYFGMTSQEHAVEHDRMRKIYQMWNKFSTTFWTKALIALVIMALTFSAGSVLDVKAITHPKPEVQKEQTISKGRGFE